MGSLQIFIFCISQSLSVERWMYFFCCFCLPKIHVYVVSRGKCLAIPFPLLFFPVAPAFPTGLGSASSSGKCRELKLKSAGSVFAHFGPCHGLFASGDRSFSSFRNFPRWFNTVLLSLTFSTSACWGNPRTPPPPPLIKLDYCVLFLFGVVYVSVCGLFLLFLKFKRSTVVYRRITSQYVRYFLYIRTFFFKFKIIIYNPNKSTIKKNNKYYDLIKKMADFRKSRFRITNTRCNFHLMWTYNHVCSFIHSHQMKVINVFINVRK